MPSVYVVGGDYMVEKMFKDKGWGTTITIARADLVVFTGGQDVSPLLYSEKAHASTYSSWQRDVFEMAEFGHALNMNISMIGICRGGQFLNVMCGGKLWQDVDSHAIRGTHRATRMDTETSIIVNVTSTHHQMMKPSNKAIVLLTSDFAAEVRGYDTMAYQIGIEAVFYQQQKCLCFQPHPEYGAVSQETKELFFEYIDKYFHIKG